MASADSLSLTMSKEIEFKRIGDIAEIGTGNSNGNEADEEGRYPFYVRSQVIKRKNTFEYDEEALIIPGEGGIGEIYHYVNGKYALHQRVYRIHFIDSRINVKFAYYYFIAHFKKHILKKAVNATVVSIRKPMIEDFTIPVLTFEKQNEIVEILDKFTDLTSELTSVLTSELAVRKLQYESYRDKLLSFDDLNSERDEDEVKWMTMKEISVNISSGGTPSRNHPEYYGGPIPWLRTQEINFNRIDHTELSLTGDGLKNSSAKLIPAGCLIIAMYGATAAKIAINSIPLSTNQACCNIELNSKLVSTDYVYHWMRKNYLNLKSMGQGSQNNINSKIIKNFRIPVPTIQSQRHIASILNQLEDSFINLEKEIQMEIENRRKQYECYRDKLLSFR